MVCSNFVKLTNEELVVDREAAIKMVAATELLLELESQIAALEASKAELVASIYTLAKHLIR